MCVAAPNDPKLSDCGGWRAGCMVAERRRPEAASVTAGAVRCSAWLNLSLREIVLMDNVLGMRVFFGCELAEVLFVAGFGRAFIMRS
jgi:hypothetical protein